MKTNAILKDINDFADSVVKELETRITEGYSFTLSDCYKINRHELHLVAKPDGKFCGPSINLCYFFSLYEAGHEFTAIVEQLTKIIEESSNSFTDTISEDYFQTNKDLLYCRLINYERNKDYLKDIPYLRVGEFAVVLYFIFDDPNSGDECCGWMSVSLNNSILPKMDLTFEEALEIAKVNTVRDFNASLSIFPYDKNVLYSDGAYCISNREEYYGSIHIFNKAMLKRVAYTHQSNVLIVPLDLHVALFVAESSSDTEAACLDMLSFALKNSPMTRDDFLSDSLYRYIYENDTIVACKTGDIIC